jgi:thimet oligopeptidase
MRSRSIREFSGGWPGIALALALAGCGGRQEPDAPTLPQASPMADPAEARSAEPVAQPASAARESAFAATCRAGLGEARQLLSQVLGVKEPRTVENTLEPFNQLHLALSRAESTAGLMAEVHPDPQIREEARLCGQEVNAFVTELGLDRGVYDAFAGVDVKTADAATRRYVEHTLRDLRRAGVDKDETARERLKALSQELVRLQQEFSKNLAEDVRSIELASAEQLKGLPADYVAAHKPGPDGKIRISTDYPDALPFLDYASDAELRRQLFVAFRSRGGAANDKILAQVLRLRAEKARLLGYKNWADYATEDKMMRSAAAAASFIDKAAKIALPRAQRDLRELLQRKRRDQPGAADIQQWDEKYYTRLLEKEKYAADPAAVREYFAYEQVKQGLLALTAEMYDVQYKPVTDANTWHADVEVYDVARGDTTLGRIYLDMHPRDGKFKHAAMFPYRVGVIGKQLPEGVLVCNFPDPRTGQPALMGHNEVTTMFHEFGHLMHHVLGGQQRWAVQSGSATEWDFVEAPSQMFEEWAWHHDVLQRFARHHRTGEVIPAALVQRMRQAQKLGLGLHVRRQMALSALSLELHTADPERLEIEAIVRRTHAKYHMLPFAEGTRFQAGFGHLMEYTALYYTYMWSLVLARDLVSPFERYGILDKRWVQKYRDTILAPGGSKDAVVLVRDFLGRPFDYGSFQRYLR